MKKYVMPACDAIDIDIAQTICVSGSVTIDPNTEVEGGFGREQGWDANNWNEGEDK